MFYQSGLSIRLLLILCGMVSFAYALHPTQPGNSKVHLLSITVAGNPQLIFLRCLPAEVHFFCEILKESANLGFSCKDRPATWPCSPLLHDILGLIRAAPPPTDVRSARDRIMHDLYQHIDIKKARGAKLSDVDVIRTNKRLDIVRAAAGVLLGADITPGQTPFIRNVWLAYEKEVIGRLPGNALTRLVGWIFDLLHSFFPALPSPLSKQMIIHKVCHGHQLGHEDL